MASELSDTHPDAERIRIEIVRRMPPWRRLQLACQMTRACLTLAMSGLRQRYPQDDPATLKLRLAVLMLGRELAERACGEIPE